MPALRTIRTVCPRNCYCTCGMLVTLDERGRIVAIDGDPDNPATGGHVCLKGLSYARRADVPRPPADAAAPAAIGPGFEPVPWDEALGEIAERLGRVRERARPGSRCSTTKGPARTARSAGSSMAFWRQFGGCTTTYGDLCWPAGLEATRLTYGANLHNHPRLTAESRFILLWGHNPAETNVHQWRLDPRRAGTRRARRRHRSAQHRHDRRGRHPPAARGPAPTPRWRSAWRASSSMPASTTRRSSTRTRTGSRRTARGCATTRSTASPRSPASTRRRSARSRSTTRGTKPALLIAGFGLQRHHRAGQTMRAVALLPALTGNVGVAGGGWQYANLASHCLRPCRCRPSRRACAARSRCRSSARHLESLDAPPIRAAWIERGNPASQNPAAHRLRDAPSRASISSSSSISS